MASKSLADLAAKMRDIDIAILATHSDGGTIAGRPMSNNSDVEYDGDSYYFTFDAARMVSDIEQDSNVALGFNDAGKFYMSVTGEAELIRDKSEFKAHWAPDLDAWFEDGIDTPGLVMIKVHAERIKYWDGEENGELTL